MPDGHATSVSSESGADTSCATDLCTVAACRSRTGDVLSTRRFRIETVTVATTPAHAIGAQTFHINDFDFTACQIKVEVISCTWVSYEFPVYRVPFVQNLVERNQTYVPVLTSCTEFERSGA